MTRPGSRPIDAKREAVGERPPGPAPGPPQKPNNVCAPWIANTTARVRRRMANPIAIIRQIVPLKRFPNLQHRKPQSRFRLGNTETKTALTERQK